MEIYGGDINGDIHNHKWDIKPTMTGGDIGDVKIRIFVSAQMS